MSNNKKLKTSDIIMDCIIGGVVLVVLIVVLTTVFGHSRENEEKESGTMQSSEEKPQAEGKQSGDLRYECVISGEKAGTNDTTFVLLFHTGRKTYEEVIEAANRESQLDKGTYKEENGSFVTSSSEGRESAVYTQDGNYLIATSDIYEGELPKGETFEAVCTYEKKNELKKTITFRKDGTYEQTLLSYASEEDSGEDTTAVTTGTYQRKGKFIQRTSDQKEVLMDFYVYKNQISDAYYQLAE